MIIEGANKCLRLYNVVIPQDFFNERVNGMDLVNAKQS
jgi:hypothetical protein